MKRSRTAVMFGSQAWARGLLLVLPLATAASRGQVPSSGGPQPVASRTQSETDYKIVREGISIEFAMEHAETGRRTDPRFQEGDLATFRFKITDTASNAPLSGVFPAAWMDFRPEGGGPADAEACREKVGAFVGGSLLAPPELDLNTYYVLALNDDPTISVVDPLFGYGTTKLLAMLFLKSPGEDWALTPDQLTLFVSLPDSGQVAVADTGTWKVQDNLDVCPRPSRAALQPDGRFLWVGCDAPRQEGGPSGVAVIDTQQRRLVKEIPTGLGHHEIVFSPDDSFAFVTNRQDASLSVIDVRRLEKVVDIPIGGDPVSLDYSPVSQTVYVADREDGVIVAVDGKAHRVTGRIEAQPGLAQIRFDPQGRLGFVVNQERDTLEIVDASVNRIIQSAHVQRAPSFIAFSDELAYVGHRDTETVLMIPLDQVGKEGAPVPVIDFPGGQTPFGRGAKPSLASNVVQAPGANAVLVANPADRVIYYYREGMAAPMGQFQNYGRQPRAVLAVDRSLEERSPGSYETTAALRKPGDYDLVFFLDSPRTIQCFPVRVGPNPQLVAERARQRRLDIEPQVRRRQLRTGETIPLRFKLTDPLTGRPKDGLADVNALTFRAPGVDRKRSLARGVGGGVYEVSFEASVPGVYYVFAACPSLDLDYGGSPFVILRVGEATTGTADSNKRP